MQILRVLGEAAEARPDNLSKLLSFPTHQEVGDNCINQSRFVTFNNPDKFENEVFALKRD